MQPTSRRAFLKTAGVTTLGLLTVSGIAGSMISCAKTSPAIINPPSASPTPASATAVPWPYKKIDPVAAAERAYTAYYNGGCMYGAFEGIIGELRTAVGAPYDTFPTAMTKYGAAGVASWGTLCGALNGAAEAICLVSDPKIYNSIISEVFGWYGSTELPDFKPAKPKYPDLPTSVADSQLCHMSVTTWCTKNGFKTTDPQRAERCAWLTASAVKYTVDLLNKQADGTFKPAFIVPASVAGCLACHGPKGTIQNVHISSQSDCTICHTSLPSSHPTVK